MANYASTNVKLIKNMVRHHLIQNSTDSVTLLMTECEYCVFETLQGIWSSSSNVKCLSNNEYTHRWSLVCWRLRIDGFVSNECRRRRFLLVEDIAAAAATPIGPWHRFTANRNISIKTKTKTHCGIYFISLQMCRCDAVKEMFVAADLGMHTLKWIPAFKGTSHFAPICELK